MFRYSETRTDTTIQVEHTPAPRSTHTVDDVAVLTFKLQAPRLHLIDKLRQRFLPDATPTLPTLFLIRSELPRRLCESQQRSM